MFVKNVMKIEEIIENQNEEIQALKAELTTSQKRCEQYMQAYDQLQHQLKELLRNRFGKKSERFIDPENPQTCLFGGNNRFSIEDMAGEKILENEIQIPAHSRKKKNTIEKNFPCRIEIIPLGEQDRICSCGACKKVISYETKKSLHHHPAIFEILEQRREIAVCPNGCDGSMITAPAPLHILPKVKATEEFLSFLVVSKLDDRQPLYHLEKQLRERHGIDCARQNMARWVIDLMSPMQPLYNLYKDQVIEYDVSACDATTLQVLDEPGRKAETKSYMYCMRGGAPGKEVVLYEYNDREHKKFIADWFAGFAGYLHVDGDNFFEDMPELPGIILVNCNAHGRRKFEPIALGAKGKGLAKEAMRRYKELYKIERKAKDNNFSASERYELRQKESKPLMDSFKKWLDEILPTVLPQSPLGKAIKYGLNRWPGLMRFLEDGRLEIDNNLTEQKIKPVVIARKNFLFAASVAGAKALCMHFSFIQTAKLYGHDPYHYYVIALKRLPHCKTVEDYEKLLPWNMNPDGSYKNHISKYVTNHSKISPSLTTI